MPVEAYINFNGNCREAVEFYASVFETDAPKFMTYGEMKADPAFPVNEEAMNLIMHTNLQIKDSIVMFSDIPPGMPFILGNNISLVVGSKDKDEIKKIFNKIKVGGIVRMDLQETFFSKSYGFLIDKFGIPWQFNLY